MPDILVAVVSIVLYLAEGYCMWLLSGAFAEPKRGLPVRRIINNWPSCLPESPGAHCKNNGDYSTRYFSNAVPGSPWAEQAAWAAIGLIGMACFHELNGISLVGKLLFSLAALSAFCMCRYRGSCLVKIFLAVLFISLHEMAFLAGYSLIYVNDRLIGLLAYGACHGAVQIKHLPLLAGIVSCLFVVLMAAVRGMLLYVSVRKIVKCCRYRENGKKEKELAFYFFPAAAGVLIAMLVRLLLAEAEDGRPVLLYEKHPALHLIIPLTALALLAAIVSSFWLYREMADGQRERAEKIILQNQVTQMQNAMVEMEHLYDGVRSVKHDMKNHIAVLQELLQARSQQAFGEEAGTLQCPGKEPGVQHDTGKDLEIRQYFEGMYQSVEQLDNRVHTGSAVSDAVVNSKFRYAEKEIKGIRLDAADFMLTDAVAIKAYDIGIILNNGLDNAIEACRKMRGEQPAYITVRSFWAKNMYFIEIENSFDGAILLDQGSGLPISAKEDKEVHGIGLGNIRNCAAKYGGDIDCIIEGERFILSVMIKG